MRLPAYFFLASCLCGAEMRFSELLYHPPGTEELEFLELEVPEGGDLTGFSIRGGISFFFAEGTVLPARSCVVVAKNPELLASSYGELPAGAYLFAYSGSLSNAGETITLYDATGEAVEQLSYEDDPPWPFLADGLGKSLVRLCMESDPSDPDNWLCEDPTPGVVIHKDLCPPPSRFLPPVVINEVMYHPRGGTADERRYEFIELFNRSENDIDTGGWRLAGIIDFEFPPQTAIEAGGFLVVAKDPQELRKVYPHLESPLLGPYTGSLDNGGAKVVLMGSEGEGIDAVTYDDDFPWPLSADGYGETPGRGSSLERLCPEEPAGLVANWESSPRDSATPGAENTARQCDLPPVVLSLREGPQLIGPDTPIEIGATLSAPLPAEDLRLVFLAQRQIGEPTEPEAEPVFLTGATYTALIPAQQAGTIVHYRLEIRRNGRWISLAPRPTDLPDRPYFGLFVPPQQAGLIPTYHLFIDPSQWARMIENIASGRAVGEDIMPGWNAPVPAFFACGNRLYHVKLRYQGSQWHRGNGFPVTEHFTCPGPAGGKEIKLLSFRAGFPRYDQFEGKQAVVLNKIHHFRDDRLYYHGFQTIFGYRLFALAGVPAPRARLVSVPVNGCIYHLMAEVERPGEEMLRRFFPGEGDLFKATGCPRGISWGLCGGPYDWADGRPLSGSGTWSKEQVYSYSFDRKTRRFAGPEVLIELIESLDRASQQGVEALREELALRFDLSEVLRYLAVSNWGCAWDDVWQNYYLFYFHGDGKWRILPWDMDQMFGGPCCCAAVSPHTSIWRGREGDPDNWQPDPGVPVFNRFKDYFFRAFPEAYLFTLVKLNNEVFAPWLLRAWVGEIEDILLAESGQSLLPAEESLSQWAETVREFIPQRMDYVNAQVIPLVDPGEDLLCEAGREVSFNASGSDPPPGENVTYLWSNGMTGARPAHTFTEPGTEEITLTVTRILQWHGESTAARRTASVIVRVLPPPVCFFPAKEGTAAFQAESFQARHAGFRRFAGVRWEAFQDPEASGGYAVRAAGQNAQGTSPYSLIAPELDWWVLPERPGDHFLWIRAKAASASAPASFAVGFDHRAPPESEFLLVHDTQYHWVRVTVQIHTIRPLLVSVWCTDPGIILDKLVLSADPTLVLPPGDFGPEAGGLQCRGRDFLRGDPTGDGTINLADPISILAFLFAGSESLRCLDSADANDDGALNVADPIYLLQYLFTGGPPPPPPFPEAGRDPTPEDPLGCSRNR